jgi:hypothetical protein
MSSFGTGLKGASVVPESNDCFALRHSETDHCFIKQSRGRFINLGDIRDNLHTVYDTMSGQNRFVFVRVPRSAYDLYLRYLETENEAYLRQAERELT